MDACGAKKICCVTTLGLVEVREQTWWRYTKKQRPLAVEIWDGGEGMRTPPESGAPARAALRYLENRLEQPDSTQAMSR